MKVRREKRLNSEFQKLIYEVLKRDIKDDLLSSTMFTVTAVDTTADLKQAKVYVSIYTPDAQKKQAVFDAMKRYAPQVRRIISSEMHIRTVPEFTFIADTSEEYGQKIDDILKTITYGENNDGNENG